VINIGTGTGYEYSSQTPFPAFAIIMVRSIDLGDTILDIVEGSELENEPGAVLWDAGLVLIYFLALHKKGRILPDI